MEDHRENGRGVRSRPKSRTSCGAGLEDRFCRCEHEEGVHEKIILIFCWNSKCVRCVARVPTAPPFVIQRIPNRNERNAHASSAFSALERIRISADFFRCAAECNNYVNWIESSWCVLLSLAWDGEIHWQISPLTLARTRKVIELIFPVCLFAKGNSSSTSSCSTNKRSSRWVQIDWFSFAHSTTTNPIGTGGGKRCQWKGRLLLRLRYRLGDTWQTNLFTIIVGHFLHDVLDWKKPYDCQ